MFAASIKAIYIDWKSLQTNGERNAMADGFGNYKSSSSKSKVLGFQGECRGVGSTLIKKR